MKKILIAFTCCLLFLSCEKDDKDELEGKWQLNEVTDVESGVTHRVDTVWYNVQNVLFMYQLYNKATDTYPASYGFKSRPDKQTVTFELQDESFLAKTDWTSLSRTFVIEKATGSQLILTSEGKRYQFKKF